jgi:hypothetical protein
MADIKTLVKMIKRQRMMLQKQLESPLLHVKVKYVWGDDEGEVDLFVAEDEYVSKAPDLFFDEVEVPDEVKDIVADVIKWRTWFEIEPVEDEDIEAADSWKEVRAADVHIEDEGVFEIGGKKYRVRKDNDLDLSKEDIEKLVSVGLLEMSADAEVARKEDLWWEEEPLP